MAAAREEAERAVESGIALGYRHIDTAARYENEDAVGRGIRASGVPRGELFITTKLRGSDMAAGCDAGGAGAQPGSPRHRVRGSVPDPLAAAAAGAVLHAFLAMAELAAEGLIRSIGVSNFQAKHIAQLVAETGLTPVVDQIECDPTIQRRALRRDAARRGASSRRRGARSAAADRCCRTPSSCVPPRAAGCTPGQVVLRWHRAKGIVPIVKSASPHRQEENLAAVGMPPLPPEVVAELDGLDPHDEGERGIRDSDTYEEL